ncbi:MAG TPA: (2Fe-2S)-binding protein [Terriglobales bacterium]|nr:(2Fe-2S)-binding protein [Terriglobales bacterium]
MPLMLSVNGAEHPIDLPADSKLLYVLRDSLGLTGTKYGCGEGMCGACTVLLDGKPARSCQAPLSAVRGKKITTIEGLEQEGRLHPVQAAFVAAEAFQCAYCTSGMIMAAVGLLQRNPRPSDEEIISALDGNVCRCGTYPRIVEAVRRAAAPAQGTVE